MLPTYRIKFECLLKFYKALISFFSYSPDLISFYLLPNGLCSRNIGPLPISTHVPIFGLLCLLFLCLVLLSRCWYGWCPPSIQVSAHLWLPPEGCFFLNVKFRVTCASYCPGILSSTHHNNAFPACLLNYHPLTCL